MSGLTLGRYFTVGDQSPLDTIEWAKRDAIITDGQGNVVFEQKDVEAPKSWSQDAVNIVARHYLRGEPSIRTLISRVVYTIANWGRSGGYFDTGEAMKVFADELSHLIVHQMMAFNSPVWYNVGVVEKPQCSACFILSVEDNLESILDLQKTEVLLFKNGSGSGSNLSTLRSSKEKLSGGGQAVGPVMFMKGYDTWNGVIKRGGSTGRGAKMVILNADHPDIFEFVACKSDEEHKALALIHAGYDGALDGPAYSNAFYQNANLSVRATDAFMEDAEAKRPYHLKKVTGGNWEQRLPQGLLSRIAEAAWNCGDPGMQFDTTINKWHTCPNSGRINASNPCSEYMFLDNTACNLASLNLLKFADSEGRFAVDSFRKAVHLTILAQEIIVGNASYPTKLIEQNSHDFRPLGLGYANLGALLMVRGLPYDSPPARDFAALITSLMTASAYEMSSTIAVECGGPFAKFEENRGPFAKVMQMHKEAHEALFAAAPGDLDLYTQALFSWNTVVDCVLHGAGARNSQATVIAPTGTIAFMMDCATTGIEPDIALVKYKRMVGGGTLKLTNPIVNLALANLGYKGSDIEQIRKHIEQTGTIEGAKHLKAEHLPVFDCAFKPALGERSIDWMGHVMMMSAVQPFVSGAISKTVNLPESATPKDIEQVYKFAWREGLKAIAVYRDGCKKSQPLSTSKPISLKEAEQVALQGLKKAEDRRANTHETWICPSCSGTVGSDQCPECMILFHEAFPKLAAKPIVQRKRLPDERKSVTHKFSIAGHDGYITVGLYDNGQPGEIFLTISKEGSVVSGLMDSFATMVSIALQYGVPLKVLTNKFSHVRFDPAGMTGNPDIPFAKSIIDYIFRWLEKKFTVEESELKQVATTGDPTGADLPWKDRSRVPEVVFGDAPVCANCGSFMQRNGACYGCRTCGATSGCS